MKKILSILILAFLFNCSEDSFMGDYDSNNLIRVKPIFQDDYKQKGLFVSENITFFIEKIKKEKIDLKSSNKIVELAKENSYEFYEKKRINK